MNQKQVFMNERHQNERHQKLLQLKTFIENTSEQYDLATDLEYYFLGIRTGCKCKYNIVRSQLNNFWESTGKKEWETFILGLRTGCTCKTNKKPY